VGLKDLFSSSGRQKSRLDRHIRTATSAYSQSPERYAAMEALFADGSDEALVGLMRRFTIVSSKSIEDEEEKGWVYRQLVSLGPKVLPACKQFCLEHENVAWALRIVEDVADEATEWDILDAMLQKHPPEYERDPAKKLQILTHVSEIDDPSVPDILARYLADPDEGVRYFCVEQLIDIGDEARSKVPLIERLLEPEEDSLRLRSRILDGLAQHAWDVSAFSDRIAPRLGNAHLLKGGRVIPR